MKSKILFTLTFAWMLGAVSVQAQDANSDIKVKVKKVDVAQQMTPDYAPRGVTEKRWRPKQWLEIDTEIDADITSKELGGREGVYPSLEFKYFIGFNAKDKDGKNIVLTGTLNFENIPNSKGGSYSHALAYITPSTLKGVLKKEQVGKADVQAVGIEIHAGGKMLNGAFYSDKGGQPWWVDRTTNQPNDKVFAFQDGGVIPKSKTPFAPLWADYDLQTKSAQ